MKTLLTISLAALLCSALSGQQFRLQVKTRTVYIVPMANGLDRYLASRLTSSGTVWVVLDPASADAIVTDRVDDAFWSWSNENYKASHKGPIPPFVDDHSQSDRQKSLNSGTVFLVDPRTSVVLWSVYQPAPNASPNALDQTADRVALSLKKHLTAK
jgi:hypothetical protein